MKIQDATREQLEKAHEELESVVRRAKAEQRAISAELGFRDAYAVRAKALAGLTPAEFDRIKALSQSVGASGVPSEEAVGAPGR